EWLECGQTAVSNVVDTGWKKEGVGKGHRLASRNPLTYPLLFPLLVYPRRRRRQAMLYPTAQEWRDWGIEDECHQFFCLHWTELFDPETPDTWQVRACNIKTILRELIDASQIADGFDAYRGVMRSILDEAFAVIKRDAILENFYPFVSAYLEPWRNQDI